MFDKRLWQAAQASRAWLLLTILLSSLGGAATVAQAYLVGITVNAVFLHEASLMDVRAWLIWLLLVIGIRSGLSWGRTVAANRIAIDVQFNLRTQLLAHVLALGSIKIYGEQTGELTAVLTEGIDSLERYFSEYLPQLFIAILVPFIILLVVFPLDWISGLILLLTAPLIPLFMMLIGRYAESLTQRQWGLLSRMSAHFLDVLQGLTTLKLLGQSKAQTQNIAQITNRFRAVTMGVLRIAFLSALVLELLSTLSIAIIAVSIGLRLMVGGMAFSTALFILILAPDFYLPLRMLGQRFHAGMEGTAAAKRIFGLLDEPATAAHLHRHDQPHVNSNPTSPSTAVLPAVIQFEQVGVTYQGRKEAALHNLNLTLQPGKMVALVGASGAGKSTVANCLLRFIEPSSGQILVDGIPLHDRETAVWREQIAWVPQKPYLFPESIEANIRHGKPDATDDDVKMAAKQAQLHEFIQSLPAGYDTEIGEQGARLSGGQAQRLALARAFLKNAPLIILDEPTSQLDSVTESALHAAVQEHLAGKMLLVIAHRLETIRHADEIVVLENGRLVEAGSHPELLARNGRYAQLVAEKQEFEFTPTRLTQTDQADISPLHKPTASPKTGEPQYSKTTIIKRLLQFISPYKKWVGLSVLLGALAVGSDVALLATSAFLISRAAQQPAISALSIAIVGVRFFGLTRGVFRYLERLVSHNVTFKVLAALRVWFYEALEPLAPARLQQLGSGDLLNRIISDVDTLENFYVRAVSPPLVALVVGSMVVIITAVFQPLLAAILLISLLCAGLILPWFIRWLSQEPGEAIGQQSKKLKETIVDTIQGLADLEAFNRTETRYQLIAHHAQNLKQQQKKMAQVTGIQNSGIEMVTWAAMWGVLLAAIPLVITGDMNGTFLATAVLSTVAAFEAVQPLPAAAQYLDQSFAAARRLFRVVDTDTEVDIPAAPLPIPNSCHFQFKDVGFQYQTAVLPTFSHVNLEMPPGKKIGIVGASGAGKSTLLNCLLRFWEWHEGDIVLNGRSLRQYDPDDIRACFSVVSQQAHLFNASIYDNLRIANPQATPEQIETAAKQAQLHEFIQQLPAGYQTQVGSLGRQLSGGEQRRLIIARAILKDAPILILDEPTANLDVQTEKQVMTILLTLAKDKSVLLVTHRPVGLTQMDTVLALENGRLQNMLS